MLCKVEIEDEKVRELHPIHRITLDQVTNALSRWHIDGQALPLPSQGTTLMPIANSDSVRIRRVLRYSGVVHVCRSGSHGKPESLLSNH
jgi:hypothetical protein